MNTDIAEKILKDIRLYLYRKIGIEKNKQDLILTNEHKRTDVDNRVINVYRKAGVDNDKQDFILKNG